MKRIFDLAAVILTSPVWLVVIAVVAVLVRIRMGRPILFRQPRPGRDGRIFELVKFRTMKETSGTDGHPASDAARLTAFGRRLRALSLDELPELWNVIKGDMSLVGPRPLLVRYLPRYTPRQARRHEVRPGLTGLAQVMGRNALTWDEKFEWDVRYVENRGFRLDMKILALTMGSVLGRRGINAGGEATMPEFMGPDGPRSDT